MKALIVTLIDGTQMAYPADPKVSGVQLVDLPDPPAIPSYDPKPAIRELFAITANADALTAFNAKK